MHIWSVVRSKLTFANVMSSFAVILVLGTGTAYAANEFTGANIVNGSLTGADIATNSVGSNDIKDNGVHTNDIRDGDVTSADILDGTITGADILDGTVASAEILDGTITATDIGANAVGSSEIATDAVQATEIANDSIDSGEVVDFGLSNQDVGVLFAQINANGTVANSSGSVTGVHIGVGTYEVDFGRDISNCAFVATQGEATPGGANGAITGATDRAGNVEGAFVTMRTDANALADRAFQMLVVC